MAFHAGTWHEPVPFLWLSLWQSPQGITLILPVSLPISPVSLSDIPGVLTCSLFPWPILGMDWGHEVFLVAFFPLYYVSLWSALHACLCSLFLLLPWAGLRAVLGGPWLDGWCPASCSVNPLSQAIRQGKTKQRAPLCLKNGSLL